MRRETDDVGLAPDARDRLPLAGRAEGDGAEEAGRQQLVVPVPVLPRRERVAARRASLALLHPLRQLDDGLAEVGLLPRAVLGVASVVADEAVRPAVRHADAQVERRALLRGVRDVHAEGRLPEDGAVPAVHAHLGEVLHVAEVEDQPLARLEPLGLDLLRVGRRAAEVPDAVVRAVRPRDQRREDGLLRRVPALRERDRPRPLDGLRPEVSALGSSVRALRAAVAVGVAAVVRRALAAVEEAVRDDLPLLQEELAARLVGDPVLRERPPRLRAVEVHAPLAHRHAGQVPAGGPRLVGEAVVDDAVDAFREDAVALRLEAVGRLLPASRALARPARERLGRLVAPSPDVREVGGEARVADGQHAGAGRAPELAHRDVGGRAVLEVVRRAAAVGLERELQAARMALFRERARVVLGEEVGDRAAEVGEEALRLVRRADDVAGEDGVVGGHPVAAPPRELLLEALRPVLRADLVAVDYAKPAMSS